MFHIALVNVWQSILKNYTYAARHRTCSNGRSVDAKSQAQSSYLWIDKKYLGRFLHRLMSIRDPLNDSFRFVVYRMKGSEEMAFGELVSVYDKSVWGFLVASIGCAAIAWRFLTPENRHQKNYDRIFIPEAALLVRYYSMVKFLLEQGDLSSGNMSLSNQKVRAFLGIILLMFIVLSNGYKNANVYIMVSPRKPLRYETCSNLVAENFTIYTLSKPEWIANWRQRETNWFTQILLEKSVSAQTYDVSYHEDKYDYALVTCETILQNIVLKAVFRELNPYLTAKEMNRYKMVHSNSHVYHGNAVATWVEQFKKKYSNWENITKQEDDRIRLLREFFTLEFGNAERTLFRTLIHSCRKTALVLPSGEAESYDRLLTSKRGNFGRDISLQQYLIVDIGGLVTPPLISRLARMKESGIVEWLANVTEYFSLVYYHRRASQNVLNEEDHPKGASLEGNITVIFTLLLAGLCAAVTGFILEVILRFIPHLRHD